MENFRMPDFDFAKKLSERRPTEEELEWLNSIDPADWKWKEISLEKCKMFGIPDFMKGSW